VTTDRASEEGFGAAGRFKEVKRGRYRLRLVAPAAPDAPLVEQVVALETGQAVTATFGWAKAVIPGERSYDIARTIGITIKQSPSGRPVFSGPLERFACPGKDGADVPLHLPLALGTYTWGLSDLRRVPAIGFVHLPAGQAPRIAENTFTLSASSPGITLDLTRLIRVGK
jgi:hypothetical protein